MEETIFRTCPFLKPHILFSNNSNDLAKWHGFLDTHSKQGSYKHKLMEFKVFEDQISPFQGHITSMNQGVMIKTLTICSQKLIVHHMTCNFILPCEQNSNNNQNIFICFFKTSIK